MIISYIVVHVIFTDVMSIRSPHMGSTLLLSLYNWWRYMSLQSNRPYSWGMAHWKRVYIQQTTPKNQGLSKLQTANDKYPLTIRSAKIFAKNGEKDNLRFCIFTEIHPCIRIYDQKLINYHWPKLSTYLIWPSVMFSCSQHLNCHFEQGVWTQLNK